MSYFSSKEQRNPNLCKNNLRLSSGSFENNYTPDKCRLPINVLPSKEGFSQAETQGKISKQLLRYLKEQIYRLVCFFLQCKRYKKVLMMFSLALISVKMKKQRGRLSVAAQMPEFQQ